MSEYSMELKNYISNEETALVGRDNGRNLRNVLSSKGIDLAHLETIHEKINIVIPEHIVSMNRSFFLGAFADRAKILGKTEFTKKYYFVTSDHIQKKIEDHIEYAIKNATAEEILNVQ